MIAHQKLLQIVERRGHPREIVEALVAAGADREYLRRQGQARARWRGSLTTPTRTVTVQRDEEHNRYLLQVDDRSNGYPRHHVIGVDFVTAAEYRTLLASRRDMPRGQPAKSWSHATVDVAEEAAETERRRPRPTARPSAARPPTRRPSSPPSPRNGSGRAAVRPSGKDVRLQSLDELVDYFIAAGKKGIAVNRYKGLGEMNPEQLWETTMNPEVRTLLQVRAEDHTEADLMFTTLMGDQVEPRRKFIEDNALDVKNLDV